MPVTKIKPGDTVVTRKKKVELSLPTEKTKPETDISRYSMFIYGEEGTGKTTLSAQFPDALHLMFEPGHRALSVYAREPTSWKEVEEYVELLTKTKTQFKNVVFDTVDIAFDMLCADICEEMDVDSLKDIGWGDGYRLARTRFINLLSKIDKKYGIIVLSHAKEPSDESGDTRISSTAMKTCRTALGKWCAITGYYYIDEKEERKLRIRPNTWCEAKMRVANRFQFIDGSEIVDIPMGNKPEESFENFMKAFNNKLEKPKPKIKLNLKNRKGVK